MLRDLDEGRYHSYLLYTDSSLVEMFVYDRLKELCRANSESIVEVGSPKGVGEMIDTVSISPFLAEKWLFVIDYRKVKRQIEKLKGIFSAETSCFFIKVSNYKEYKEVLELLGKGSVCELYLSFLQYRDIVWLLRDTGMKPNLIDYVVKSYSRDPEKVFLLLRELQNGLEVSDRKEITAICGESSGSVMSFVISLLVGTVSSDRGLKMSLGRKSKEAVSLARLHGVGSFRNFMIASVRDIMYLKEMYLNCDIYDTIRDVPDCFDEKKLMRYRMYLSRIVDMDMSRVVRLYAMLCCSGKWISEIDVISFLYEYYKCYTVEGEDKV